ncbi:MAG: TRAP transporter substrate-binding protein [Deltaproteobacteria bacterium]|nr:TRAP transporter substrate-binding protein [Deltaproteobacteria bacterium]
MKKQKKVLWIVGLICAGAFLFYGSALARPIELNFNLFISATHERNVHCHKPWIENIEKASGGKVKITPYYSNSLTPLPEKFDATVAGIADISECLTWTSPWRFALSEMLMLPELGMPGAEAAGKAWWHMYKTEPAMQKNFAGVKLLFVHTSPHLMIATRDKPIRKLDDLKGLKICAFGKLPVQTVKALGATPVGLTPGEVYLALDKGVIDGTTSDFEINLSRRFYESTKYIVTNIQVMHTTFFVVMNQGVWDGLPPDVQKAFEQYSGDWAVDFYGKTRDREEQYAKEKLSEKGVQFTQISPEESAKAKKLVEPVKANYAAEVEARGMPGKKVLEALQNYSKK